MSSMTNTHCAIQGCKTSVYNRPPGVSLHACPTSNDMRNKWLNVLKNRCAILDWGRSKLCSKHFENKYFDSQRKLKDSAIPTLFPVRQTQTIFSETLGGRSKVERLLSRMSQSELVSDIKGTMNRFKEPEDFENVITDNLRCRYDASNEAQLWLLVKKQNHLNNRLLELVNQNKKRIDTLQKNAESNKMKKDTDQSIETYKYIVKSLQEKLATLEEQIEILTAVESR